MLAGIVIFIFRGGFGGAARRSFFALLGVLAIVLAVGAAAKSLIGTEADRAIAECEERIRQGELLYDCEDEGLIIVLPLFNTFFALIATLLGGLLLRFRRRKVRM